MELQKEYWMTMNPTIIITTDGTKYIRQIEIEKSERADLIDKEKHPTDFAWRISLNLKIELGGVKLLVNKTNPTNFQDKLEIMLQDLLEKELSKLLESAVVVY